MKTCPVCKANCFDDMPVCYGCLHDFTRLARRAALEDGASPGAADDLVPASAAASAAGPTEGSPQAVAVGFPASANGIGRAMVLPSGYRVVVSLEPLA